MNAILLLLLMPSPADLAAAEEAFRAGVEQRDDAERARPYFRRAARLYEEARQAGADNADLALSHGNAAYLGGDLAGAILAYQRGLRLDPVHPELRANLAHARTQVIYPHAGRFARPAIEHRPPWLPRWPGVLAALVLGLYLAACLALARWWMVRTGPWRAIAAWCFVAALLPLAGLLAEEWHWRADEHEPLVVIAADDVRLRQGNGMTYPPVVDIPLNRGVEARRLFERHGWLQIELGSGEVGWVQRADCLIME